MSPHVMRLVSQLVRILPPCRFGMPTALRCLAAPSPKPRLEPHGTFLSKFAEIQYLQTNSYVYV